MFTVELYAKVRHAVMIEGLSRREAAKRFGIHRNTITKMLSFSVPPGFLAEVRGMPQRNLAVELLQKLLKGELGARRQKNVVQAAPSPRCWSRPSGAIRTGRLRRRR